jgi:hypothetical protein
MRKISWRTLPLPKRRHIVALVVFSLLLLATLYFVAIFSEDYETAEQFVAHDSRVSASIGKVQRVNFKFWDGFDSVGGNGGSASYSFNAITDKGEFVIEVHLRCSAGIWRVEAADIRAHDGALTHIAVSS